MSCIAFQSSSLNTHVQLWFGGLAVWFGSNTVWQIQAKSQTQTKPPPNQSGTKPWFRPYLVWFGLAVRTGSDPNHSIPTLG